MNLPDLGFKKMRGLGDTVESLTRAIGIKKPCSSCAKRKKLLNELVPYRKSDENSTS